MDNAFDGYKCPICNGTIRVETRRENMGGYSLPNPRLVCNHCKIKGGYAGVMLNEEEKTERLIYNFEKAVASRKFNNMRKPEKILTDIRDYLKNKKELTKNIFSENDNDCADFAIRRFLSMQSVEIFVDGAISDLTEYAEKLGVEL